MTTPRVFTWTHAWEVSREPKRMRDAVAKARAQLPGILATEGVIIAGPHRWQTITGTGGRHSKVLFSADAIRAVSNFDLAMEATMIANAGGSLNPKAMCPVEGCDRHAGPRTGKCLTHRSQELRGSKSVDSPTDDDGEEGLL